MLGHELLQDILLLLLVAGRQTHFLNEGQEAFDNSVFGALSSFFYIRIQITSIGIDSYPRNK